MGSMAEKMREKAIPATSTTRSSNVVKSVSRADVIELNQVMKSIIEQNRREYEAGLNSILNEGKVYRSSNISSSYPQKLKTRKNG